jgi:3-hydroxyisobutyrate dehydrogenase-like beta-hydroxyacid dehydrogenase
MTDISVFGLGLMGSALARALIKGGNKVTVWNRSPAKAQPLIDIGANRADSLATAVEASPILLVCVDNYQATRAMFEAVEVMRKLSGRVIIQLSTGSPKEARESESWFNSNGAQYLDGAILNYPIEIGTPNATILYAGRRDAFDQCHELLKSLSGNVQFVGARVGSAATLDLAWLSKLYGTFAGVAHGVILCESEGDDLDLYSALFAKNDAAHWIIDVIKKDAYENPQATLNVWNAALRRIIGQAGDVGINSEVPDFVAGILDRAEIDGHGHEDIAAMVKVLRGPSVV